MKEKNKLSLKIALKSHTFCFIMLGNIPSGMLSVIQKYHRFSEGQFDNMHQQIFQKCMVFGSAIKFLRMHCKQ